MTMSQQRPNFYLMGSNRWGISLSSFCKMWFSTIPANIGGNGHPCKDLSSMSTISQEPSSSLTIVWPWVRTPCRQTGGGLGNLPLWCVAFFCLNMELNIFFMSMDNKTLVGRRPSSCLLVTCTSLRLGAPWKWWIPCRRLRRLRSWKEAGVWRSECGTSARSPWLLFVLCRAKGIPT